MNIISNDDEGSPRGSDDAGGNQYLALVLCPEGLFLDLNGLNYSINYAFFYLFCNSVQFMGFLNQHLYFLFPLEHFLDVFVHHPLKVLQLSN